MSAARCPRCATPTLVPGHDVHVCTSCGGVWLDAERGHRLLAPLGADLQQSTMPQTAYAACPWCGQAMHICLTRLAGVEIDVCAPHGVWFDRHELERVSQVVSRINGQPVPQAPAAWSHAQGPAGQGPHHAHGASGGGMHPGMVAGAAAVGVAAAGVAAYAAFGDGPEQAVARSSFGPSDALSVAPDVVSTGADVAEVAGGVGEVASEAGSSIGDVAGDALSSVAEVGADAAEAAGSVLGSIFEAITGIFS